MHEMTRASPMISAAKRDGWPRRRLCRREMIRRHRHDFPHGRAADFALRPAGLGREGHRCGRPSAASPLGTALWASALIDDFSTDAWPRRYIRHAPASLLSSSADIMQPRPLRRGAAARRRWRSAAGWADADARRPRGLTSPGAWAPRTARRPSSLAGQADFDGSASM